jgi:hypothetical protein
MANESIEVLFDLYNYLPHHCEESIYEVAVLMRQAFLLQRAGL